MFGLQQVSYKFAPFTQMIFAVISSDINTYHISNIKLIQQQAIQLIMWIHE